ncbi:MULTISPECIES: metal ABC transporter permease [Ferrimonas]|uniref:metal ABC transporter permease n=1 Tax=Ferrimonas TaxID=44011 RepID=UPI00040928C1|nr:MULTISPECIES: metal ABC transporter permease [Ferrimonas]USD37109.1 metal ABC transporter permease [Ferrimonas sp. SCSIO 43195]
MFDLTMFSILLPALAAGLLVLASHVVMGRQVLARGIIFIDLAIAQIAALGAVIASTNHELAHLPAVNLWMPAVFALLGAGVIALLEKHAKGELEAMIGCLYVLSAVAAMLVLAKDPHGGELLKQLLSGQILWTDWAALKLPALATVGVLGLLWWRPSLMSGRAFYPLFAVMITFSVQLVGVYLVFSSLILPALAVNRLSGGRAVMWGYGCGISGYLLGLWLSASWDLPSGATIVCTLAGVSLAVRLLLNRRTRLNASGHGVNV